MNIRDLEKRLKDWGAFWASKRKGEGYASTSMTEQCCKIMRTGIYSQGTSHLFSAMSDNIHVPDHIKEIDEAIKELNPQQKKNLKDRFINKIKVRNIYIDQAMVKLCGIL